MHCVFYCAASASTGLGHLLRCLALSQALVKLGHTSTFLLSKSAADLAQKREDWIGQVIIVESPCSSTELKAQLAIIEKIDWFIVDAYELEAAFFASAKYYAPRVALFDDMTYQSFEDVDLVINSAVEFETIPANYSMIEKSRLALGRRYRLLRNAFIEIDPKKIGRKNHLTLCFGGSDPFNLTPKVLDALENSNFPYPIRVITGAAFANPKAMERRCSESKLNIDYRHDVQDIAREWCEAALVVSAAGGSQFELCACKTPSILIVVAENQRAATHSASVQGWCVNFDFTQLKERALEKAAHEALTLMNNEYLREKMSASAVPYTNTDGPNNLVSCLHDQLGND